MKIYIDGYLSTEQETFLPTDLHFSNEECDDNTIVNENCIKLVGHCCEGKSEFDEEKEKYYFTCRWKGVDFEYENEDGDFKDGEDFTIEEFMKIITEKKMRLTNMSAYCDTDVDVQITELIIIDGDERFQFPQELIDEIEFMF